MRDKYQKEFQFDADEESDEELDAIGGVTTGADAVAIHVALPTQDLVAQTLLEKKKKDLLASLS